MLLEVAVVPLEPLTIVDLVAPVYVPAVVDSVTDVALCVAMVTVTIFFSGSATDSEPTSM